MKGTEYTLSKDGKLLAKGPLRYDYIVDYLDQFGTPTGSVRGALTFIDPIDPNSFILVVWAEEGE